MAIQATPLPPNDIKPLCKYGDFIFCVKLIKPKSDNLVETNSYQG